MHGPNYAESNSSFTELLLSAQFGPMHSDQSP